MKREKFKKTLKLYNYSQEDVAENFDIKNRNKYNTISLRQKFVSRTKRFFFN